MSQENCKKIHQKKQPQTKHIFDCEKWVAKRKKAKTFKMIQMLAGLL
jgi:hypothetical protein